jgi:hypothetical protein
MDDRPVSSARFTTKCSCATWTPSRWQRLGTRIGYKDRRTTMLWLIWIVIMLLLPLVAGIAVWRDLRR